MGGELREGRRKVPPAVDAIETILATHGALGVPAIAAKLRSQGFRIAEDRLPGILERFVDLFDLDSEGQVILASRSAALVVEDAAKLENLPVEKWWLNDSGRAPLDMRSVVALDVETTGLDPKRDQITEIAVVEMDGSPRWTWRAEGSGPSLKEALSEVSEILGDSAAVLGHNLRRFDLPFLAIAAKREDVEWEPPTMVLDVHQLSLLVTPTLDGRSLGSLCDHFCVDRAGAHKAHADARAIAAVARTMLKEVDVSQASWVLALRIASHAGWGWERLLPPAPAADLVLALDARDDPLVHPGPTPKRTPVRRAVSEGFARYGETVQGYRERPMQVEMAESVGDVLDSGGHLLVEAPTGTGKTLAYLVPSAWRGARVGTPVVISTHTKVLQRQLRTDAVALRSAGLLNAPFRQIQGVNNYLCPRNIADTIEANDPSTNWFAVAVAVRSLAKAENGVWDDVTDELEARSDLRYRRQRSRLRATSGTCDHQGCDFVRQCPMYKRLDGIEKHAGVVATNHSLLAQWAKQVEGTGNPPGKLFTERPTALVVDEAHNLENSLTEAWATRVGGVSLNVMSALLFGRHGWAN